MKFEIIKSYILAILVGVSFILTFSLWSYQNDTNYIDKNNIVNENERDLGGQVETIQSIVQPSSIIFNKDRTNFYGFQDVNKRDLLYQDIQTWVLYNFRQTEANGRPNEDDQIEIIFPDELPMEIIPKLFSINNANELNLQENMNFQRIYITFRPDNTLTFIFLSTDGKTQIKADVNNTQKYDLIENYLKTLDGLVEYLKVDDAEAPIYLPLEPVDLKKYSFGIKEYESNIMRDALFIDQSRVVENVTDDKEKWYFDGQRTMHVFANEVSMEYISPQDSGVFSPLSALDLLDKSISRINDYKGWTQDFRLGNINMLTNEVEFQMYYDGYPVINQERLSSIRLNWVNGELSELERPIFKINYTFLTESSTLPSGYELMDYLRNQTTYKVSKIQDIQVGYRAFYQEDSQSKSLNFNPAWFVKIDGTWKQINMDNVNTDKKGVN